MYVLVPNPTLSKKATFGDPVSAIAGALGQGLQFAQFVGTIVETRRQERLTRQTALDIAAEDLRVAEKKLKDAKFWRKNATSEHAALQAAVNEKKSMADQAVKASKAVIAQLEKAEMADFALKAGGVGAVEKEAKKLRSQATSASGAQRTALNSAAKELERKAGVAKGAIAEMQMLYAQSGGDAKVADEKLNSGMLAAVTGRQGKIALAVTGGGIALLAALYFLFWRK